MIAHPLLIFKQLELFKDAKLLLRTLFKLEGPSNQVQTLSFFGFTYSSVLSTNRLCEAFAVFYNFADVCQRSLPRLPESNPRLFHFTLASIVSTTVTSDH